jgi:hypothetical protein
VPSPSSDVSTSRNRVTGITTSLTLTSSSPHPLPLVHDSHWLLASAVACCDTTTSVSYFLSPQNPSPSRPGNARRRVLDRQVVPELRLCLTPMSVVSISSAFVRGTAFERLPSTRLNHSPAHYQGLKVPHVRGRLAVRAAQHTRRGSASEGNGKGGRRGASSSPPRGSRTRSPPPRGSNKAGAARTIYGGSAPADRSSVVAEAVLPGPLEVVVDEWRKFNADPSKHPMHLASVVCSSGYVMALAVSLSGNFNLPPLSPPLCAVLTQIVHQVSDEAAHSLQWLIPTPMHGRT